jgi:hypothetical protein
VDFFPEEKISSSSQIELSSSSFFFSSSSSEPSSSSQESSSSQDGSSSSSQIELSSSSSSEPSSSSQEVLSSSSSSVISSSSSSAVPSSSSDACSGKSSSSGQFCDSRNGETYNFTKIGDIMWMTKNLNYDCGDGNCKSGYGDGCSWLYSFSKDSQMCPNGWRLPTKDEFDKLIEIDNFISDFNYTLCGQIFHSSNNENVENYNDWGVWWSSTEDNYDGYRLIIKGSGEYEVTKALKDNFFSVRCIKDDSE